jgi:nucleotide-binding universal stress UspA family protein
MRPIICATRGSEASYRTQERAIAIAQERGTPLIFLYIVDSTFIEPADKALTEVVIDELEQLGRRLLCIAQARAREHGLQADIVIRHGAIQQTMENFLSEVNASVLVIGAPQRSSAAPVFNAEAIAGLVQHIRDTTGAEVIIVA